MAKICFINSDGGGFASELEIRDGLTVGELFQQKVPHGKPQDFLIRCNRQATVAEQVLREGDRVTITPTKIEGA